MFNFIIACIVIYLAFVQPTKQPRKAKTNGKITQSSNTNGQSDTITRTQANA